MQDDVLHLDIPSSLAGKCSGSHTEECKDEDVFVMISPKNEVTAIEIARPNERIASSQSAFFIQTKAVVFTSYSSNSYFSKIKIHERVMAYYNKEKKILRMDFL